MTAVGQEQMTEDAFEKGANYYIMKPFNNRMLLDKIKHVNRVYRRQPGPGTGKQQERSAGV